MRSHSLKAQNRMAERCYNFKNIEICSSNHSLPPLSQSEFVIMRRAGAMKLMFFLCFLFLSLCCFSLARND